MATNTVDYITIEGFKSIAGIKKLSLRDINLLIGANGAGKSNFIEVFSFLSSIIEGRLQRYVRTAGGAEQVLHFGSKVTTEIILDLSFMDKVNGYHLSLNATDQDSLFPTEEKVTFWDKRYAHPYDEILASNGDEAGISGEQSPPVAEWVRSWLRQCRVYHVHDTSRTSPMRKSSKINDNEYLRPDGSNLPAFLYLLQRRHAASYKLIRAAVRRVAPFFDDFSLRPDPLNTNMVRLEWKNRESDKYFGPAALSDGTLRFIALSTLFLQPEQLRPSLILVDEPELGLHPYAITILSSLIKQVSADTQVIVSTQSSLLLDHFEPEDVLVARLHNGGTKLDRLDSHRLRSWLKEYSLGQLWEKNEIGGRPE